MLSVLRDQARLLAIHILGIENLIGPAENRTCPWFPSAVIRVVSCQEGWRWWVPE